MLDTGKHSWFGSSGGTAQGVARALDFAGIEGLVGTVAGDDTVFAAMDSARSGTALLSGIKGRISR